MSWRNRTSEEWFRLGFLALFLVGIASAVLIIFFYHVKK